MLDRIAVGCLPGDRWVYRGVKLATFYYGVEVLSLPELKNHVYATRRLAQEAIDRVIA